MNDSLWYLVGDDKNMQNPEIKSKESFEMA